MLRPTLLRAPALAHVPTARWLCAAPKSRTTLIKELRARTAAPMKKCVEALSNANDDIEEAITLLRKSGLAAAQKKASRGASEGAAAVAHGPLGAAVIELNSETDFVARNVLFQELAANVARTALGMDGGAGPEPLAELDAAAVTAEPLAGGTASVGEALGEGVQQLGENLVVRRATLLRAPAAGGGVVSSYVHNTYAPGVGRTAAALVLKSEAADVDALQTLGERLAMHIVAASPQFLDRGSVDAAAIARERDILLEQARASGKPDSVIEKMVDGRLKKFYGEVCLLEQTYLIEENGGAVAKVLEAAGKELGAPVEVAAFVRFHVGEGAEAEAED